jgi:hypothetical protein
MKVGDLVKDTQFKDIGVILKCYQADGIQIYSVFFSITNSVEELTSKYLRRVSESR